SKGFTVLPQVFDAAAVTALRDETVALAKGERGNLFGYDLVRGATDEETLINILAIHFPHKISDLMHDTMFQPDVVKFLNALIGPDVKAMQSMLFVKAAGKPGHPWHQDEHFIPTRDQSLTGVWIALDDATIENGCMWMHPGSHASGVIWPMKDHHDPRFDHNPVAYDFPYDEEGGEPVEVKAGDVAIFNGYTLHRSLQNNAKGGMRRALVYHYMNARSLLPWDMGPTPTLRKDYRDIVMISGDDPYAWKGTEQIIKPFLRPDDPEIEKQMAKRIQEKLKAREEREEQK
ncbi:MAG: phytanoyl-CoA dioxygenase family protein, partial [Alphaproteobacteria bacterium]